MRLLINGIPLLTPHSGVGTYVYHLAQALTRVSNDLETLYFYGKSFESKLRVSEAAPYIAVRKAAKNSLLFHRSLHFVKECAFKWRLPSQSIDLYHETNFIPMPFKGPTVVTVFDLSLHLWPHTHPKNRRDYFERNFYRRLPWANHFITISEAVKKEMVEHLHIPPSKITVTPLGLNSSINKVGAKDANAILKNYGLTCDSYILYVGTLEPRKNLTTLLQAYARLPKQIQSRFPLVLAGGRGWLMDTLEREINSLGIGTTTIITGYVPKEDLPSLYSGARVFVYPSLYEGFGLPPLEAMACGTPVITSNISSLPEVVGDAGITLDPKDVDAFKEAIHLIIEDPFCHQKLSQKGLQRSSQFSWDACARATLQVYRSSSSSCISR